MHPARSTARAAGGPAASTSARTRPPPAALHGPRRPPRHPARRRAAAGPPPPRAAGDGEDQADPAPWEGWQDWAGPPAADSEAARGGQPSASAPGDTADAASSGPPASTSSPADDPNAGWDAPIYRRTPPPDDPTGLGGLWGAWPFGGAGARPSSRRAGTTPDGRPGPARPPRRAATARGPRDEFMRPIADAVGVRLRLGPDPGAAEDEYGEEALANAAESGEAATFAGALVLLPLAAGFAAGQLLGRPALEVARARDTRILAPSPRQRGEGGRALREHEVKLRMEAAIGRAPPLTDAETVVSMQAEAARLDAAFRAANETALVRLLSDTVGVGLAGGMLVLPSPGRAALFGAVGRVFSGLSDMAKAFLIIASTDIFLGYHSEEGWKALAHVVTGYYGLEVSEGSIFAFVAVVPVVADAFFKLWIFKSLNRSNPGSAVTLKSMKKS